MTLYTVTLETWTGDNWMGFHINVCSVILTQNRGLTSAQGGFHSLAAQPCIISRARFITNAMPYTAEPPHGPM